MSTPVFESHLFSYYHDGSWYSFQIKATSAEDARARVNRLPLAQYDGVVAFTINGDTMVPGGFNWRLTRRFVWEFITGKMRWKK